MRARSVRPEFYACVDGNAIDHSNGVDYGNSATIAVFVNR
jgi:hypothetical protein